MSPHPYRVQRGNVTGFTHQTACLVLGLCNSCRSVPLRAAHVVPQIKTLYFTLIMRKALHFVQAQHSAQSAHMNAASRCVPTGVPSRLSHRGRQALQGTDTDELEASAVLSVPLPTAQTRITLNDSNEDLIPTFKGIAVRDACVPGSDGVRVTHNSNRVYMRTGVTLPANVPADVRVTVTQFNGAPDDVYTVVLPPRLCTVLALTISSTDLDITFSPWASAPNLNGMLREWTRRAGPMRLYGVVEGVLLLDYATGITPLTANSIRVDLTTAQVLAANGQVQPFSAGAYTVSTDPATAALATGVLPSDADLAAVLNAGFSMGTRLITVQYGRDSMQFTLTVGAAAHDTHEFPQARVTGTVCAQLLQLRNTARPHIVGQASVAFRGDAIRAGASEYITLPTGQLRTAGDVAAALQTALDAQRTQQEAQTGVPVTHGYNAWLPAAAAVSALGFELTAQTGPSTPPVTATVTFRGGPLTQAELVEQVQAAVNAALPTAVPITVAAHPTGGIQFTADGELTINFTVPEAGTRTASVLGYAPANAVIVSMDGTLRPNSETLHVWRNAVTGAPLPAAFTVAQRTLDGALMVAAHASYPCNATVSSGGGASLDFLLLEFAYDAQTLTGATPGSSVLFEDASGALSMGVVLGELPDKSGVQVLAYTQLNNGDATVLRSAERVHFSIQTDPTALHALPPTVLGVDTALTTRIASGDAFGFGTPHSKLRDSEATIESALFTRAVHGEARFQCPPAVHPPPFLYIEAQVAGQTIGDVVQADAPPGKPRARMLAVLPYDYSRRAYVSPGVNAFSDYFPTPRGNATHLVISILDDAAQPYHPCQSAGVVVLDLL